MKSRPIGVGQNILASQNNDRRDDARSGGFLLAHQQLGALSLGTNPTNGQTATVVVNGTSIVATFVTAIGSAANNILIGASAAATVQNFLNWLRRPDLTNGNQVAASSANQQLLAYVGWAWPGSSTSIVPFSLNKNVNGITNLLTSFNITTTVTSGSWTAQTMQLYVEDGTYYINGTRYLFTGGSTPTVTPPVSNPRIDVLMVNASGTLAWTTGTENASPVAPSYPENDVPIIEIFNVVGETALYDNENQQSGEGYISNDVRPLMAYGPNFGAFPTNLIPDATNTRSIGSSSYQFASIYGENVFVNGNPVAGAKFGGTGADGALSITSGATTLNLGGAAVFIKNYTSISITGSGVLNFSNPNPNGTIIILKSQGNVTLTSSATPMLDASGMGAAPSSNAGQGTEDVIAASGGGGSTGGSSAAGAGAAGTAVFYPLNIAGKKIRVVPGGSAGAGAASANGGAGSANGGVGGAGGGALIVECAGALDFTTTSGISVAGLTGSAGTNGSTDQGGGGGGGGGAGGTCALIYNSLTANTGSVTVSGGGGGTGGNHGTNSAGYTSAGGGGGAGGSNLYGGGSGGNAGGSIGGNAASGANGGGTGGGTGASGGNSDGAPASSKSPGGGGGGGAAGASYAAQNTEFS
jgi:hypothetical protein